MKFLWILVCFLGMCLSVLQAQTQVDPGEPFGTPSGRKDLQQIIYQGDSLNFSRYLLRLRSARGLALGMAIQEPFYRPPDSSLISEAEVEKIWNGVVDQWMVWEPNCPENSQEAPMAILALVLGSREAQLAIPEENLRNLATLLDNQQYKPDKTVGKSVIPFGAFGVVHLPIGEVCGTTGSAQRLAQTICKNQALLCVTYSSGLFSGKTFVVADQSPADEFYDGQLTHYQAFGILEMLHAFSELGDSTFFKSALLAGDWCLAEIPMAHPVLTSRLIASFAALYEATGELKWKLPLRKMLNQYLIPAILMDENGDGLVDGNEPISFSGLVSYASKPGRMWDGQNASSWNSAISAHALLMAYSAFRNQKDETEATRLKPFLVAMMDNLCSEIINGGTPPMGTGFRDLCFSVLDIQHHLARAEGIFKPEWEKAVRILWNARVVQKGGEFSLNVGQFVRFMNPEWNYRSLRQRIQSAKGK